MAHTGYACPKCDAEGKTNPLMTNPGVFGYSCQVGHIFPDTEQLKAMNPRKIDVPKSAPKPREGLAELRLSLPGKLITALRERFKDKLERNIEAVLIAVLDTGSFIVTGFDATRLKELFGAPVPGPDKLVGMIYNLRAERDEARKEADAARAAGGAGGAVAVAEAGGVNGEFVQVTLRIGIDEFMTIKDKAKFNGKNASDYIGEVIQHAVVSGWF